MRYNASALYCFANVFLFTLLSACSSGSSDTNTTNTLNTDPGTDPENTLTVTAEAGAIQAVYVGEQVNLSAILSSGDINTFHWTFRSTPGGSEALIENSNTRNPSFVADRPGTYVAQLVVTSTTGDKSVDFAITNVSGPTASEPDAPLVNAIFDHTGLIEPCSVCHAGDQATASTKSANHIKTSNECGVCHRTLYWVPSINVDHNEVIGVCSSCHNGVIAPGKNPTHIPTSEECNACHNPGTTFTLTQTDPAPAPDPGVTDPSLPPPDSGSGFDHTTAVGTCVSCHNNVDATGKPQTHLPTTDNCDACHTVTYWAPALLVDHTQLFGACSSCHNNITATGKSVTHVETALECDACHITTSWFTVTDPLPVEPTPDPLPPMTGPFDHSNVTGTCVSCHDSVIASGKSSLHIPSTDLCETCHGTDFWVPTLVVDHTQVLGTCSSCHDNIIATGKSATHTPTTDECDLCHNTLSWLDAVEPSPVAPTPINPLPPSIEPFDHTTAVGACVTCHDGVIASGKSAVHILSSDLCDACHTVDYWVPSLTIDHTQVVGSCSSCHNGIIAAGKSPTHVVTSEDCDVCHLVSTWIVP